jgi:hypothetical protein
MEIQNKIKQINQLNADVANLQEFVDLCKKAQTTDVENAKGNELQGVNRFSFLEVGAYICTGTQSPPYHKKLMGDKLIVALMREGLAGVEKLAKEKEQELENLIK